MERSVRRVSNVNSSLNTGFRFFHFTEVLYFRREGSGRSCLKGVVRPEAMFGRDVLTA